MEKIGISWAVCCLVLFSSSLVSTTHWVPTDNSHVVKRQAPVSIYGQRAAQSFGQAQQICRVCSMCYSMICCKDYLCVYQPPPNYATTSTRPYNYGTYSTNLNPVYTTERTTTTARIPLTSHSKDTIVPSVPPNIGNRDNFEQSTPKVHLQNTPNLGMASIDYSKFYNTTTGISLDRVLPERKYSFAIPSSDH